MTRAPEYMRKRNILGAFLIKSISLSLNEQLDTELVLFRNVVTLPWIFLLVSLSKFLFAIKQANIFKNDLIDFNFIMFISIK